MTRRQWMALVASSLPLACKSHESQPVKGPRKKGLCLSSRKRPPQEVARFLEVVGARWMYNWNISPSETLPAGVEFIPMIYHGRGNVERAAADIRSVAAARRFGALLGFNEPDAKTQGNTTVEQALDAWPILEATGLRLGSPSCVHPDNEWMKAFMKGVEERGLRVDFICMHSYGGPGADSLVKRLETIRTLYQRPIWITEFAVADWEAKTPGENRHTPERVANFVAELLPRLEAMDFIERYAWFHGGVSGAALASSQLFNPDGSLTIVGEAYRAVG
jgi:hypothetical protein